jgi:hypothetical protein
MLHTIAVTKVALPRDPDACRRGAALRKRLSCVALISAWLEPSPNRPRWDTANGSRQRCAVVIWIVASVIDALVKSVTIRWEA